MSPFHKLFKQELRSPSQASLRRTKFEEFEQRLTMTASATSSVLPELDIASPALTQQEVTLDNAHTQAANLAAQYGFDGAGQTIAVIDSGIAFDHLALGGGFGEGHKVVGGWDFAENDANPYDDGPAGFHGTHVAGIIGSNDADYKGVSSGADLVALRVFGDRGEGELEWVEQALQWVHDHKDDFENPITTVNLSLGTHWNSDTVPDWQILEDEFAQLELDGLFISVAAGNAFKTFGEAGLSYPAVSEHVVPVASHGADGQLSDFSQRDEGVLVAPGELLRSTAPNHLFGGMAKDQFVGSSGTSMAAPYVAGASAILRQANEFMGADNITQEVLYNQFMETAEKIYDSVTKEYYYRMNLDAALESVVQDRHGNGVETATSLGSVGGGETIEGTIGKIADIDSFEFTAKYTGRVTLNFEVTDNLVPLVDVIGIESDFVDGQVTFDVVAGQKYNFAVASAEGNGHYRIAVDLQHDTSQTGNGNNGSGKTGGSQPGNGQTSNGSQSGSYDWGTLVSSQITDQQINGNATFEMTSARNGLLTIQANYEANSHSPLQFEVYDSQMNLLESVTDRSGDIRFDIDAEVNETFFVKVIGKADSVDFRVDNLVSLENGFLAVHGTNQADQFSFNGASGIEVNINGVGYEFDSADVSSIHFVGHNGNDSVDVVLGATNDRVSTGTYGVNFTNDNLYFLAYDVQNVSVDGGGGYDVIAMIDSEGDDVFRSGLGDDGAWASLDGYGISSKASGFDAIYSRASGGNDTAIIHGSSGADNFMFDADRNMIWSGGSTVLVDHYESAQADGMGGKDVANLYDTSGDDSFELRPGGGTLTTDTNVVEVNGFERTHAFSRSGSDSVVMHDSAGDDVLYHADGVSVLSNAAYLSFAQGFANVEVIASEGNDIAQVFDTAGNDLFFSTAGSTKMVASDVTVETSDFTLVNLIAKNGGYDTATAVGTDGVDVATATKDTVRLANSNGQTNSLVGMDTVSMDLKGGKDLAYLIGSEDQEILDADYDSVEFETTLQMLRIKNANHTTFEGNGGGDEVNIDGFTELDLLESLGDKATAYLQDRTIIASEFDQLEAQTVDDALADYDLEAIDYLYMLRGKWQQK